ncbi:unnamed protein product [Brachionus calyciflorus]|uniref:Chromo domain-containing protein n=1 Tax=Brachionus calyciflorus TaxID=104777 RepID=A0A813TMM4_9BILA|nr:unnamed protein product [Brachionus calyciflorus]
MNYEEFVNFRSSFYFFCGKQFFIHEFGIHPDRKNPMPRNQNALMDLFKKHGVKPPNFYNYYNLWRSCDQNVYVKYNRNKKQFYYTKKYADRRDNLDLFDYVNHEIQNEDLVISERFGKSIMFFKFLCAFVYAKTNLEEDYKDVLNRIEKGEIVIPKFEDWNRDILEIVWDGHEKIFRLEKIKIRFEHVLRPIRTRPSRTRSRSWSRGRSRKGYRDRSLSITYRSRSLSRSRSRSKFRDRSVSISYRSRSSSIRRSFSRSPNHNKSRLRSKSSSSSQNSNVSISNSDVSLISSEDGNELVHPEDILWEYDSILNERVVDGKIQFLVKWKDFGDYKFEPTWENESMVNTPISRVKRPARNKFVQIADINDVESVVEFYKQKAT